MPIGRNSFIQMTKLNNVKGRISYISSHARQENLYSVYETVERSFWKELAKCNREEFKKSGTDGKCIEARELIIALPENFVEYNPDALLRLFTEEFHKKYGVECISALHHNKRKTNYHIHLIFAERKKLEDPVIKVASRNIFYDENGKHVRTKREISTEDGEIREGCSIVKKGDVYEKRIFTIKDNQFKSDKYLDEVKHFYTDIINQCVQIESEKLQVFDHRDGYLPTKKIGKNNPKAEKIKTDNYLRQEWNHMVDRAYAAGAEKEEVLSLKQEHISMPVKKSVKSFGNQPNLFTDILRKAIGMLRGFVQYLHEIESTVKDENGEPIIEKSFRVDVTPEKLPDALRPSSLREETEVINVQSIMNKIIKQEKRVYSMERKQVLLKKEQKELNKKWFHGKEKKDLEVKLMENSAQLEKARSTLSAIPKMYGYENVLAVKNDLNKAEERLKKVQKIQSDWDAKQNEKMYLVIPATEHVEASIEEQKKNIKERLEEKRQEVKKQEKQQKVKKSRGMEL